MLKKNGVHYNADSQSLNPSMIALVSKGWGRLRLHNFPESSLRSESWNFLRVVFRPQYRGLPTSTDLGGHIIFYSTPAERVNKSAEMCPSDAVFHR